MYVWVKVNCRAHFSGVTATCDAELWTVTKCGPFMLPTFCCIFVFGCVFHSPCSFLHVELWRRRKGLIILINESQSEFRGRQMCRAVVRWLVFAWPVWLWVVWVVLDGLGGLGGWVVCVALPGGIHSAVQGRSVGAILIVSARRPLRLAACLFLYITIYIRLCVCVCDFH